MQRKNYSKAQIYLTECTHPQYTNLRYIGLDTKCDPNYLGSSVALKWWINYLGRNNFTKTVLEEITGTMTELCSIEQKYILEHDAVRSPFYFNMNGGSRAASIEDMVIDMNYIVRPTSTLSQTFVDKTISDMRESMGFFSHSKRQLASRVLCMMLYGYIKYDQCEFEYNSYTHYGTCKPEDFQDILSALSNLNIANSGLGNIIPTEEFLDSLPELSHEHFSVQLTQNH